MVPHSAVPWVSYDCAHGSTDGTDISADGAVEGTGYSVEGGTLFTFSGNYNATNNTLSSGTSTGATISGTFPPGIGIFNASWIDTATTAP